MAIGRREFLRLGGTGLVLAGLDPGILLASSAEPAPPASLRTLLGAAEDYPFPYDSAIFACAERVYNVRRNPFDPETFEASLSLILQPGKICDVKILAADALEKLAGTSDVQSFSGVGERLEAKISGYPGGRAYYQVQYREGSGAWKALSPKAFKLPSADLESGGAFKVIMIADDHTFDDANWGVSAAYREMKLNGDYVNEFLKTLRTSPLWDPPDNPIGKMRNGLFLARALRHILYTEDADLLINLGDTNGLGAPYRWAAYGLPAANLKEDDYDLIARTFWLRMRKMYSAVTPFMPMVIALGNHDGEESWSAIRSKARQWRNAYFPLPGAQTHPEGGDSASGYFAFSLGADAMNRGGAQFIVLDITGHNGGLEPAKPEGWTMGNGQREWVESLLAKGEKHWRFICFHHVLGGWPGGPAEGDERLAYGRGPLFQAKDYLPFADPETVEQVKLTENALRHGVQAFFYGHDHIFKPTYVAKGAGQKDLYGICAGSTKDIGESSWWKGTYWRKYYGDAFKKPPDFWGPPGYVRLTIQADAAKVEYVAAGYSTHSNLTPGQRAGDVLSGLVISSPRPKFAVDKAAVTVETTPRRGAFPSIPLRVQNGGGGTLSYRIRSTVPWLTAAPEAGKSWGEWRDHSLKAVGRDFEEGTYDGSVLLEAENGGAPSLEVPVRLVVGPPPVYPPTHFTATRTAERTLLAAAEVVLLAWRPNRLNGRVVRYKVYLADVSGGRMPIGEVPTGTLRLAYRSGPRGGSLRFALTAVDDRGRESEAVFASVD